jgi:hypothetical protein
MEYSLVSLLGRFRDFVQEMMEPHPRDEKITGIIYSRWDWDNPPAIVDRMLSWQEPTSESERQEGRADPFGKRYRFTCEQLNRLNRELGEVDIELDERIRVWVKMGDLWDCATGDILPPERMTLHFRRMDYYPMCNVINVFYRYLQSLVMTNKHITPDILTLYELSSYKSIWDGFDLDKAQKKRMQVKE